MSLFVAGAIFCDVAVPLWVAGAVFVEIRIDSWSGNGFFFNTKCVADGRKVSSATDGFSFAISCSDHAGIVLHCK